TIVTISDSAGKVVRRLSAPGTRGVHRVTWNLRGIPASGPSGAPAGPVGGGRGGGGRGGAVPATAVEPPIGEQSPEQLAAATGGGYVPPGTYKAALVRRAGGISSSLGVEQTLVVEADPNVSRRGPELTKGLEYQERVIRMERALSGATQLAN